MSGERTEERGVQRERASSPQPSPPLPHEQTGCRGLLFSTRLFLLLVPFLKSFARSRNYILPHAILLEQTVHLSAGRAKWRDHFLSRLPPNGIVLTSSFSGSSAFRFFS